jgi:hypothetical protein
VFKPKDEGEFCVGLRVANRPVIRFANFQEIWSFKPWKLPNIPDRVRCMKRFVDLKAKLGQGDAIGLSSQTAVSASLRDGRCR